MNAAVTVILISTESVAEFLHDSFGNYRPDLKPGESPPGQTMWLGKVLSPGFEHEVRQWRFLAEDFIKWFQRRLGDAAKPHPLAAELTTKQAPDITTLTAERDDLNARLLDVTAAAAVTAGRIERLQDELARVRKHETELIQDRDRLIHKDLAQLHKEVDDLKGELENERAARKIYSDRLAKSDSELAAALDRERRLSERLANVASLVSDM
jgi:hypothetical protein